MKKNKTALLLLSLFLLLGTKGYGQENPRYDTAEKVIITGKAGNLKAGTRDLEVILFYLGFESEQLLVPVDTAGRFRFEFETYAPMAVSFRTPCSVSLTAFPDDSIHMEFNGGTRNQGNLVRPLQGRNASFQKADGRIGGTGCGLRLPVHRFRRKNVDG